MLMYTFYLAIDSISSAGLLILIDFKSIVIKRVLSFEVDTKSTNRRQYSLRLAAILLWKHGNIAAQQPSRLGLTGKMKKKLHRFKRMACDRAADKHYFKWYTWSKHFINDLNFIFLYLFYAIN